MYDNIDNWYNIPTPYLQSILDFQFNEQEEHEDICRWMYILIGRMLYDVGDLDDSDTTSTFKSTLRHTLGYNLLTPVLSPSIVQLFSEKALELKQKRKMSNKCTDDHLFGVTDVGISIFLAYKNSGWNIDDIVNKWIPKHLYLWLTVKILKKEHQGENSIARAEHTLEEKINLVHYTDKNIPIYCAG